MKARIRALGDFLALLAGARRDLMAREPGSRARHITMGGVVLSTGAFAALSMAFALHMAAGAPWPLAVALGLGWGVVIVNLDRLLIVGMRHDTSTRRTLLLAAPRVVLALILGVVIATPLTLQIFRSEIDTKVTEIHLEQAAAVRTDLDNDPRFTDIPVLQERIAANEQIQRTEGRSDPGLAPVYAEVDAKQEIYDREQAKYLELQAAAIDEGDGSDGTGVAGHGPQWEEKAAAAEAQRQVAASALADLQAAQATAADAEAAAVAQARSALDRDRPRLEQLTADRDRLQALYETENADNTGLLIRLTALHQLTDEDDTLGWAYLALEALFISVELLPVLNKVLLNLGRPTAYDKLLEMEERTIVDTATFDREVARLLASEEADSALAVGRDRIARQQKTALKVNADVVRQQQRIVTQALAVWGEHTEKVAADQLATYQADLHDRRAVPGDPPPFVSGTPDWTMSGAPGQPSEPVAPWSNPPDPRTPGDTATRPPTGAGLTAAGNFTVDPTAAPNGQPGSAANGRVAGSPFVTSADLPSADDL